MGQAVGHGVSFPRVAGDKYGPGFLAFALLHGAWPACPGGCWQRQRWLNVPVSCLAGKVLQGGAQWQTLMAWPQPAQG